MKLKIWTSPAEVPADSAARASTKDRRNLRRKADRFIYWREQEGTPGEPRRRTSSFFVIVCDAMGACTQWQRARPVMSEKRLIINVAAALESGCGSPVKCSPGRKPDQRGYQWRRLELRLTKV